ncbi:MAG: hypothetical protein JNL03_00745 [Prolixibacteraceae bacterium]|nr:hypothetical protein [Prolixibacteraceae bacterium]
MNKMENSVINRPGGTLPEFESFFFMPEDGISLVCDVPEALFFFSGTA